MKAGTSALFSGLAEHPEILGSLDKEPAHWVKDFSRPVRLEPYLDYWNPAEKPNARWWMEGSTDYAKVPVEPSPAARLRHLDAELRFIFVTRNPVDRVRSHYEMALAHGWIKHPITVELDPTAVWFSNYYQQLKPFVDCFGRESIHVISHEEMTRDPDQILKEVAVFLGLPATGMPTRLPRANEAKGHRAIRHRRALAAISRTGATCPESMVEARLDAEITPTEQIIAHLHAELDHDLLLFKELFGVDPWTGAIQREPQPDQMLQALRQIRCGV